MGAFPFAQALTASDISVVAERTAKPAGTLDVLVVEDDPIARRRLVSKIRELGHACRSACDGEEAWRLLQERRADVVISDWEMPGLTGAELCRLLRKDEDSPYTYFVLMTDFRDREHLLLGMAAGADDYQKKPIDLDELEARLVSAARVVSLHRKLAERTNDLRRDSSQLWAVSRTDPLTGVGNRRRMQDELESAFARARRYGQRCSIAMFDLDLFKQLNDQLGHVAGDHALCAVAAAIQRSIRAADAVFRYGGEEFVVLFPEQRLDDARQAAERIREEVERLAIPRPGPGGILTISAGVAELDLRVDEDVESWLARADAALYLAKSRGRNRVVPELR